MPVTLQGQRAGTTVALMHGSLRFIKGELDLSSCTREEEEANLRKLAVEYYGAKDTEARHGKKAREDSDSGGSGERDAPEAPTTVGKRDAGAEARTPPVSGNRDDRRGNAARH